MKEEYKEVTVGINETETKDDIVSTKSKVGSFAKKKKKESLCRVLARKLLDKIK